jgi:hypothetical protein
MRATAPEERSGPQGARVPVEANLLPQPDQPLLRSACVRASLASS